MIAPTKQEFHILYNRYLVGPEVCILDWLLRPLVGPEPESNYRKEVRVGPKSKSL